MAVRRQEVHELRLTRRYLMVVLLCIPLLLALAGFGMHQRTMPVWPLTLEEAVPRGRILAANGTILAEGAVSERSYPQGELAAHLLGCAGAIQTDGRYGLEGLEYTMESTLHHGLDVYTTLDPTLQAAAESKLAQSIAEVQAESGTAVILEARTGRILASASYPTSTQPVPPSTRSWPTEESSICRAAPAAPGA
jgi:cell division protein FtsI (penicillin-binding protein 3)